MSRMTKNGKSPESRSALIWILPAGGLLALGFLLLRPESPSPAAVVPAAAARVTEEASMLPVSVISATESTAEPAPAHAAAEPAPAVRYQPAPPLVREGRFIRRGGEEAPWQLPAVSLSPDEAAKLTPEQRAQFEKLSRDFLSATDDPAAGREEWARARERSDEDFRAFFGDELFFAQQHRVALHRDDAPASANTSLSDPP